MIPVGFFCSEILNLGKNFNLLWRRIYNPNRIITTPPTLWIGSFNLNINSPNKEAPRPKDINIQENPSRKKDVYRTILLRKYAGPSFISLKDTPLIKERKDGTRGRMQGEKK